ncbi:MAG TPA: hypothetical protein VFM84_04380 [Holophagaceae bacterium]|nr:hypothetical protein [Holophagaceae bacterium]
MKAFFLCCALALNAQAPLNSSWDFMMKPLTAAETAEFRMVAEKAFFASRGYFEQRGEALQTKQNDFGCKITTGSQVYGQPQKSVIGKGEHIAEEEGPSVDRFLFTLTVERAHYPHQISTPGVVKRIYGDCYANTLRIPGHSCQFWITYKAAHVDMVTIRELEKALLAPFPEAPGNPAH